MNLEEIENFANTIADLADEHTNLSAVESDWLYNLIYAELAEYFEVDIEQG